MGIWIRSQDKKTFAIICGILIVKESDSFILKGCDFNARAFYRRNLGEYSTEEKAIFVLDLINSCIKYNGKVFQMPTDEEV